MPSLLHEQNIHVCGVVGARMQDMHKMSYFPLQKSAERFGVTDADMGYMSDRSAMWMRLKCMQNNVRIVEPS